MTDLYLEDSSPRIRVTIVRLAVSLSLGLLLVLGVLYEQGYFFYRVIGWQDTEVIEKYGLPMYCPDDDTTLHYHSGFLNPIELKLDDARKVTSVTIHPAEQ
jgi:hypothetical protein